LAALQKLPAAEQLLERLRSSGEAVVLFSSFVFPLLQLQRSLGGELLCGRVELAERQRRLERFQQGRSNLLLATYGVAGLGLGLQRASQVVLLERPWTPGDAEQAEDRCHRIGSRRSVTSHWLQLGSADALVDGLILSKADRIEVVLGQRRRLLRRQPLTRMLNDLLQP
jgi:SNF2 family DNA or RNA helicase